MKKGINLALTIAASLSGAALSLTLSGCPSGKVNSLKSAIKFMSENKNYTLSSQFNSGNYELLFAKNYVGKYSEDNPKETNIYLSDKNGTYQLEFNLDEYVGSEYRSTKNVWDTTLVSTFKDSGDKLLKSIKNNDTEITIKDKEYRVSFMTALGYKSNEVINLDTLTASYNESLNGVLFTAKIKNVSYKFLAHKFGTTTNEVAEGFLKNGHAFNPTTELIQLREGIEENNFIQDVYNYGQTPETTGFIAAEYFHPNYFYSKNYSSSDYNGYISLYAPEVTDGDNPHPALDGIYSFSVSSGKISISPYPWSENRNIIEAMNYPTNLSLLKNFHKITEWNSKAIPEYEPQGYGYYTADSEIVKDFSHNFQMDRNFQGEVPTALGMDLVLTNQNQLKEVTFYYVFMYGTDRYVYPIKIREFGKVSNQTLDKIYQAYNILAE